LTILGALQFAVLYIVQATVDLLPNAIPNLPPIVPDLIFDYTNSVNSTFYNIPAATNNGPPMNIIINVVSSRKQCAHGLFTRSFEKQVGVIIILFVYSI